MGYVGKNEGKKPIISTGILFNFLIYRRYRRYRRHLQYIRYYTAFSFGLDFLTIYAVDYPSIRTFYAINLFLVVF